jgi:ribosomal-protein-alanine N-acetyltransferase
MQMNGMDSTVRFPDSVCIRAVVENDVSDLLEIEDVFATDRLKEHEFRYALTRPNAILLAAVCEGYPIGYAFARINARIRSLRLFSIATKRAFQSRGVGGCLLGAMEESALACAMERIHLEVRRDNLRAQRFYMRRGFAAFGVYSSYYSDGTPHCG